MALIQIKKANVGEQVYQQMKNQILTGEWKPGDRIPSENQLIELFGVSRGTVRQAVQKLVGEGLVLTRRGDGSFVKATRIDQYFQTSVPLFPIGEEEMSKIFEFREMFESGVTEVAAQKATEAQLRKLEQNYQQLQRDVNSIDCFVRTDLEFHKLICECTQNTLAIQIYNSYEELLGPSILCMTKEIGFGNGLKYHGLILGALQRHDPVQARQLMQEHLSENMSLFEEMNRRKQD